MDDAASGARRGGTYVGLEVFDRPGRGAQCGLEGSMGCGQSVTGRLGRASVVVWLTRDDLVRPVELLEQHHSRQLVREGHGAQRQSVVGSGQLEPERPADDEAKIATLPP